MKLSENEFRPAFFAYVETKARPLQQALKTENNVAASLTKDEVLNLLETQDTFALHLRAAHLFEADGETDNAVRHFRRAIELFPYYTGDGNAYESLAKILELRGNPAQVADVLEMLVRHNSDNVDVLKVVARMRLAQGDRAKALEALQMSFFINPFDYATHLRAGELYAQSQDYRGALAEFQTALACTRRT